MEGETTPKWMCVRDGGRRGGRRGESGEGAQTKGERVEGGEKEEEKTCTLVQPLSLR
jgi:hypothetical protein